MRADAQRNRERILSAARDQIAAHGFDVPMTQIARAAGVAVGTLYRHHPSKHDLVQAIFEEHSETLLQRTESLARALKAPGDAISAIKQLLGEFLASATANRAFTSAAAPVDAPHSTAAQDRRARAALTTLVDAARADRDLRDAVDVDDVLLLISSAPLELTSAGRKRWLEISLAGIGTRELPESAYSAHPAERRNDLHEAAAQANASSGSYGQ